MLIPPGNIKRVHVNQHVIKSNIAKGEDDPCLTVKTSGDNFYGREVIINGPSRLVTSLDKPLSCGARVWIETHSEVEIV